MRRNATDVAGGPAESWLYPAYAGKALIGLELGIPFGEALTQSRSAVKTC